ncbi:hypothetical protein LZ24_00358 [Desulfobotulus alkaliphilus]|uniref:Uncharacterized protein n=1 Tax=Desulfobotulus alkaliphilus TaxID=622671 RepID=A0A562S605_9BACT|nr:hypothetical protein LZ24_00358 [Desulfobotulus alkaliphilus]
MYPSAACETIKKILVTTLTQPEPAGQIVVKPMESAFIRAGLNACPVNGFTASVLKDTLYPKFAKVVTTRLKA